MNIRFLAAFVFMCSLPAQAETVYYSPQTTTNRVVSSSAFRDGYDCKVTTNAPGVSSPLQKINGKYMHPLPQPKSAQIGIYTQVTCKELGTIARFEIR